MNTTLNRNRIALASLLTLSLAPFSSAQIQNGFFELGGPGIAPPLWTQVGGVRQDSPEAAGLGGPGINSARFMDGAGMALSAGYKGAGIGQRFQCDVFNPANTCYVRFVYAHDAIPAGARAFVWMNGAFGPLMAELPDNLPAGPSVAQVGYPGCGNLVIKFGLLEPGGGAFQSTLMVDNVIAQCGQPFPLATELQMSNYTPTPGAPATDLVTAICTKMGGFQGMGGGSPGGLDMFGEGSVEPGSQNKLILKGGAAGEKAFLILGVEKANVPMFGGTLVPSPITILPITLTGETTEIPFTWPANAGPFDIYTQASQGDTTLGDVVLFKLSNGLWIQGQ